MKQNIKLTLSAIITALSVSFMLLSYFPYLTYGIPAISGLFMIVLVIEINEKWAFVSYIASSILIFFVAENESKLFFICLLGYYPILKALIERIRNPLISWLIKILTFNLAVGVIYLLFSKLFNISIKDFYIFGKGTVYLLLLAGNFVFVIYDIAVSRMAQVYYSLIRPKISKFLH